MATIEQLEAEAAQLEAAEATGLTVLAEAAREVAVQMPDGSGLARNLAVLAQRLDQAAGGSCPAASGGMDIQLFVRDRLPEREETA